MGRLSSQVNHNANLSWTYRGLVTSYCVGEALMIVFRAKHLAETLVLSFIDGK